MNRLASIGFTGMCQDGASLRYPLGNGYRWYLPGLMRFNAPDSLSPFGPAGINAYAYCQGDPVNFRDPSGHIGELKTILEEEVVLADLPLNRERVTVTNRHTAAKTGGNEGLHTVPHPLHEVRKILSKSGYMDRLLKYKNEIRRGLAIEQDAVSIVRERIEEVVASLDITLEKLRVDVSQMDEIMIKEYPKLEVNMEMAKDELQAAEYLGLDTLGMSGVNELKEQIKRADVIHPQAVNDWKYVHALARRVERRLIEKDLWCSVGAVINGGEASPP